MAEEQAERMRKENTALRQRLQAALAALAAYGSPLAGPAGLAARMAQVCLAPCRRLHACIHTYTAIALMHAVSRALC